VAASWQPPVETKPTRCGGRSLTRHPAGFSPPPLRGRSPNSVRRVGGRVRLTPHPPRRSRSVATSPSRGEVKNQAETAAEKPDSVSPAADQYIRDVEPLAADGHPLERPLFDGRDRAGA